MYFLIDSVSASRTRCLPLGKKQLLLFAVKFRCVLCENVQMAAFVSVSGCLSPSFHDVCLSCLFPISTTGLTVP